MIIGIGGCILSRPCTHNNLLLRGPMYFRLEELVVIAYLSTIDLLGTNESPFGGLCACEGV